MPLRYDYANMLRTRVGNEGVSAAELAALFGRLEAGRRSLETRRKEGTLGFFDVPKRRPGEDAMRKILRAFDPEVETLVVLGIGGSLLGAQAVHRALHGLEALRRSARTLRLVFAGDATDPSAIDDLIRNVDWKRAAVNVISKSGDTLEPMSVFLACRELLRKAVGPKRAARRVVTTTDPERGALRRIAERDGCETLPIPANVGGRFSVFTEAGAFPLLASGINVSELWAGAASENESFWRTPTPRNAALLYAGLQYLLGRKGKSISVLMPYVRRLELVAAWYRQLWAESLGKQTDRQGRRVHAGFTPVAAIGPADQHSQIQLYNEGPFDKSVTFIEVESFDSDLRLPEPFPDIEGVAYFGGFAFSEIVKAERRATAEALAANRRPNATIVLPELSGRSLGGLLQMLMNAAAACGELLDVNAFNQPGVEAGKRELYRLLGREGY